MPLLVGMELGFIQHILVPLSYTGTLFLIKNGFFVAVAYIINTKVVMMIAVDPMSLVPD